MTMYNAPHIETVGAVQPPGTLALGAKVAQAAAAGGEDILENALSFVDYQPDASGKTLVRDKLNQAIKDVSDNPDKDTLVVPEGIYLVASIHLQDNVRLYLEEGAVLLGSLNEGDYREDGLRTTAKWPIVVLKDVKNVAIDGEGTIDGNWRPERMARHNLFLLNASNVTISGIHSMNHMGWNTIVMHSNHVLVDGVTIKTNPASGNIDDGIDVVSSHDIEVANCDISVVDDGIVVKNKDWDRKHFNVYNVHVHDNIVSSKYVTALKLGTESTPGNWSNILFENNKVPDGNLRVFISDGAVVKDVTFRNNDFYRSKDRHGAGNGPDLTIQVVDRAYGILKKAPGPGSNPGTGSVEMVRLENVRFHDPYAKNSTLIRGKSDEHNIGKVVFDNVYMGDTLVKNEKDLRLDTDEFKYVDELAFVQGDG